MSVTDSIGGEHERLAPVIPLFGADRSSKARGAQAIRVATVPQHGLGRAINDRLRRAAAPRD